MLPFAIESGLFAAQTILEADGKYARDRLAAYEQKIVARFGPRRTTFSITNLLPQWVAGPIAGRLFRSAWFVRHVVLERWFLHAHQPPLAADERQPGAPTARRRALGESISDSQTAG